MGLLVETEVSSDTVTTSAFSINQILITLWDLLGTEYNNVWLQLKKMFALWKANFNSL